MRKTLTVFGVLTASLLFAESFTTTETIKVTHSEPIYRTITSQTPIQECWDETEEVMQQSGSGGGDVVGALVGGAIGGALGHQVGQGSGKTAATIGGAIIGSMIGQNAPRSAPQSGSRVIKKCKTRYETRSQQVLSGYNNYATLKGKTVIKFSELPLEFVTVYTTVSY